MTIVTTYTQQDFDLLVSLGMPDTQEPTNSHYFEDEETQAIIEFSVSDIISKAYTEIKGIIARSAVKTSKKIGNIESNFQEDMINDAFLCHRYVYLRW